LIEYEAMGLVPEGQGARAVAEGLTEKNGPLPVNPSGGLKAKGHPIGATGVSMHALTAMQLMGAAGDIQVTNASLGGFFNRGGKAVATYVSILERIKERSRCFAPRRPMVDSRRQSVCAVAPSTPGESRRARSAPAPSVSDILVSPPAR